MTTNSEAQRSDVPGPQATTAEVGAYAPPLDRVPPSPSRLATSQEAVIEDKGSIDAEPFSAIEAAFKSKPYALVHNGEGDADQPLVVGSHPYAARDGSAHRRRIGDYVSPGVGQVTVARN